MEIEVGDILETGSNCFWTIVYSDDKVVKIQLGKSNFTHLVIKNNLLHNVHVTKMWAIKKKVTVLDMSVLEEL